MHVKENSRKKLKETKHFEESNIPKHLTMSIYA